MLGTDKWETSGHAGLSHRWLGLFGSRVSLPRTVGSLLLCHLIREAQAFTEAKELGLLVKMLPEPPRCQAAGCSADGSRPRRHKGRRGLWSRIRAETLSLLCLQKAE